MVNLKRDLTLFDLIFYGVGIILGAGIYVLVGHAAAEAGNAVWMSFVIAAVIASFTGLSYAELSSMYPKDAAEYTFVKTAFKDTTVGFVVGWLTFVMTIIAGAAVSLGFGQYLNSLTGVGTVTGAAGLIILFAILNYTGIKISSRINIVLTSLTVLGLLIIIAIGLPHIGSVDYFETPTGFVGIFGAAAIVFFAYLGFDEIVNVSEEAKSARKNVPKAIVISVVITTVIYILVALSAVSVVPWQQLGQSGTPMALVAEQGVGAFGGMMLGIFALFATASTVLILMIAASRMLFGMAEDKAMPKALLKVGKRKTPYVCILLITAVSLVFVMYTGIKDIALLVDFSAFFVFAMINLSALILRFTQPNMKRQFKVPLNIGRVPLLPLLGFLISSYMIFNFAISLIWYGIMVMVAGYVFYKFQESENGKRA
ncbi:MAG: amino acid permease [archaeon GW2011_AR5]|nr:MAG: amino acid permease [archaeon GW2011_AR5]